MELAPLVWSRCLLDPAVCGMSAPGKSMPEYTWKVFGCPPEVEPPYEAIESACGRPPGADVEMGWGVLVAPDVVEPPAAPVDGPGSATVEVPT